MPANTVVHKWACKTTRTFSTEVESSSSSSTYVVKFGPDHHREDLYMNDWSCTCRSYKFQNGTDSDGYCKHIRKVKDEDRRCGWDQMFDSGDVDRDEDENPICPECGSDVHSNRHAV